MILQILTLLGALGMFLYGMNMMSDGLQKAAGNKLRTFLSFFHDVQSGERRAYRPGNHGGNTVVERYYGDGGGFLKRWYKTLH